jgi:hypothetical protein
MLVRYGGEMVFAFWQAFADGYQGFVPTNAKYTGNGSLMLKSINPGKLLRGSTSADARRRGLEGQMEDDSLRLLNGATDADPEILLARTVRFQRSEMSDDRRMIQEKRFREGPIKYPGLTDCTKNFLSNFYDRSMLDAITWEHGVPWHIKLFATVTPGAYTSGDHIYFEPGNYHPLDGISDAEMEGIAHEVAHVRQFRENGSLGMTFKYLWNSTKNGVEGFVQGGGLSGSPAGPGLGFALGYHATYYGNKFEHDADRMERTVSAHITKHGNPCR